MDQRIENIRLELFSAEHWCDYEQREEDPVGFAFNDGYVLGLERALAMLAGEAPWLDDEIVFWWAANR